MCLAEVIGQLGVGPVGPVEPLAGRPLDDPAADDPAQVGRDGRGVPLGLEGLQGRQATPEVGVEPSLDGARRDAQVGGDVLVGPTPMGHADDLEAIPDLAVSRLQERLFESSGLDVVELDADHGEKSKEESGRTPPPTNRTASAGL